MKPFIKLYGASDDLVEIENGPQEEEYGQTELRFETQDGTIGEIKFTDTGEWKITLKNRGVDVIALIEAPGEGTKHEGPAEGCPGYSDVLIFTPHTVFSKLVG